MRLRSNTMAVLLACRAKPSRTGYAVLNAVVRAVCRSKCENANLSDEVPSDDCRTHWDASLLRRSEVGRETYQITKHVHP